MMICNPGDVVPLVEKYAKKKQEYFGVILLNNSREVIATKALFIGGVSKCIVDPKVVFHFALKHLASAIILFHNHPSGILEASDLDIKTTSSIEKGCEILGVQLLDHVIVSKRGYLSFMEKGMICCNNSMENIAAEDMEG